MRYDIVYTAHFALKTFMVFLCPALPGICVEKSVVGIYDIVNRLNSHVETKCMMLQRQAFC